MRITNTVRQLVSIIVCGKARRYKWDIARQIMEENRLLKAWRENRISEALHPKRRRKTIRLRGPAFQRDQTSTKTESELKT